MVCFGELLQLLVPEAGVDQVPLAGVQACIQLEGGIYISVRMMHTCSLDE